MTRLFTTDHGDFPLSAGWWKHVETVRQAAGGDTRVHAHSARKAMMDLSNERARGFTIPAVSQEEVAQFRDAPFYGAWAQNPILTLAERAQMYAGDRVFDLHTQAALLHPASLADFGFDCLDQVFVQHVGEKCGCRYLRMHDNHDQQKAPQAHRIIVSCAKHAPLAADPKAHLAAIEAEARG